MEDVSQNLHRCTMSINKLSTSEWDMKYLPVALGSLHFAVAVFPYQIHVQLHIGHAICRYVDVRSFVLNIQSVGPSDRSMHATVTFAP